MNRKLKDRRTVTRALLPLCSFVSFVVMFSLLSGCTIGKEPRHPNWKNATGAEQYERLMWQAIRDKNWRDVEYHLGSTFVGVNPQGRALDRAGWIEYWKGAEIKELTLGEFSVQPSGTHMVVTFVLHLVGTAPERPFSQAGFRVISVWQQVKSGWSLSATSAVPLTSE